MKVPPLRSGILLSCAGRRAYLGPWFREALEGKGQLVGADADPTAPALQEVDDALLVPPAHAPDYIDVLFDICSTYDIGLIVSLNDVELLRLSQSRERFLQVGTHVLGASPDLVAACLDKLSTVQLAQNAGVPYPETFARPEAAEAWLKNNPRNAGLIVKPRWGSGSIGLHRVTETDKIRHAWEQCALAAQQSIVSVITAQRGGAPPSTTVIAQEWIEGDEYGLDVVNDLHGNFVAGLARKKLAMRGGETDRAMPIIDSALSEAARSIGTSIGHSGVLDCDFLQRDDDFVLLEINPRFGGGYPFCHTAGAHVPRAIVAWMREERANTQFFSYTPDQVIAKADRMIVCANKVRDVRATA